MNYLDIGPEEIIEKWYKKNKPSSILDLTAWAIEELPDMPDTVEHLDISNTTIKKIEKLPTNLKYLKCKLSDVEEFPLVLPSSLIFIDCRWCENLKPFSVEKGVTIKDSFQEYIEEKELKEENHIELAYKRIEEWKKKKNPNKLLNLSRLKIDYLPEIPDEVEWMNCDSMCLKSLKGLPKNLKRLSCSGYAQKEFDYLPEGLEYLKSNWSQNIETIDNLPNSLKKLELAYYSHITAINKLPQKLRYLDLNDADMLKEINCPFPESLRFINLTMTDIVILPILPESVRYLNIFSTKVQVIPNLPNNLKVLDIQSTCITLLPKLPDTLLQLYIHSNNILNNNPLPKSIHIFESNEFNLYDKKYK